MTLNTQPYPPNLLALQEIEGFTLAFEEMLPKYKFRLDAYEALEGVYEQYFGRRRFDSYQNFCQSRRKYFQKRRL